MSAIIAHLTITLDDGATLSAPNDVQLARRWAEHVHGPSWHRMPLAEQLEATAVALGRVREEFGAVEPRS